MRAAFSFVLGCVSLLLLALNTLFWCIPLLLLAALKPLLPASARRHVDRAVDRLATCWIGCNDVWIGLLQRAPWTVQGTDQLQDADAWYLVVSNHRSWVDIFVLQRVFNRRIPLLKFFLKQQLIYVPVVGLAWWALGFPFMRRPSRATLRKNPQLRHQDRDTTRRACATFLRQPTSVMNFVESTRYTDAKRESQASPYRHLLKPKAGALALTLNAMGENFLAVVDVTVAYPDGTPSFWDLACGRVGRVCVDVRQLPVPPELRSGDYSTDKAWRNRFHAWLDQLWQDKDQRIDALLSAPTA